jgi:hypothetical protein
MRALATAIESYAVDNNVYPTAATCASGVWTTIGAVLTSGSFTVLVPTYIAVPPLSDGWGRFNLYGRDAAFNNYNITSYGRDGLPGPVTAGFCGTTNNFNDDIMYSNGTFLAWPEGPQN